MKNKMRFTVFALSMMVFSFMANNAFAQTATEDKFQTVTIKTSAVCGMCERTIETAVYKLSGIKEASLDVDSKVLTVTYNTEKTNVDEIKQTVIMSGYDADEIPADPSAYEKLHGCCKKDAH